MNESLPYVIKYHTDDEPSVRVFVRKVSEGVHAIIIDFDDRFCVDGYGGGDNENGSNTESVMFGKGGDDDPILFEVEFNVPSGMIIGEACKRCYRGTYYEQKAWSKLWKDL